MNASFSLATAALIALALSSSASAAAPPQGTLTQLPGAHGCVTSGSKYGESCGTAKRSSPSNRIAMGADGELYAVAADPTNAITAFRRNASTGLLTEQTCIGDTALGGDCVLGRGLGAPTDVVTSSDGSTVYVTALSGGPDQSGAITVFHHDPVAGTFQQLAGASGCLSTSANASCGAGRHLTGPEAIALSPDGKNAYVAGNNGVSSFAIAGDGSLTQLALTDGCFTGGNAGADGCQHDARLAALPGAIAVSPDGKYVYVGMGNDVQGGVLTFDRDAVTGKLTRRANKAGCIRDNGNGTLCYQGRALFAVLSLAVSPDGATIYAGGSLGLAVLVRQPDGSLQEPAGTAGCLGQHSYGVETTCADVPTHDLHGLAVAPDGASVYGAGGADDRVVALQRSSVDGTLTALGDPYFCVDDAAAHSAFCTAGRGLGFMQDVALSADGRFAYAAGLGFDNSSVPGAVTTFSRQTMQPLPSPPTVTTGPADQVTEHAARLHGTVNPNGTGTTWHFEYSTDTSFNHSTPPTYAGSGTTEVPVSADVTGLTSGATYHVRLVAISDASAAPVGGADVPLSTIGPPAPAASVLAADVGVDVATLHGHVDPRGADTTFYFEYGTTTDYGTATASAATPGNRAVDVAAVLAGLSPNTTYHYRLAAHSANGHAESDDASFTTGQHPPPAVVTRTPTGIAPDNAVLQGSVNPEGTQTSWHYEWGTDTTYGKTTPVTDAGAGAADVDAAFALGGLTPHRTYHYRLVATSTAGTVAGGDIVFATPRPGAPPHDQGGETHDALPSNALARAYDGSGWPQLLTTLQVACAKRFDGNKADPDCERGIGECPGAPIVSCPHKFNLASGFEQACPFLNKILTKLVVICLPTYLAGTQDLKHKSLIVVPPGALFGIDATVRTKGAIEVLGPAGIFGSGVHLHAAQGVGTAGGWVQSFGDLELTGKQVSLGSAPLKPVIDEAASHVDPSREPNPAKLKVALIELAAAKAAVGAYTSGPTSVWGARISISAPRVLVTSSSRISADGLGYAGTTLGSEPGYAPPGIRGADLLWGGSHAGFGGDPVSYLAGRRGAAFDDMLDPHLAGGGGGGDQDFTSGASGGGVVAIKGDSVHLDGAVSADGDHMCALDQPYRGGGAGAGGSVNVRARTRLSGSATIRADGGGMTPHDYGPCLSGEGGGGMIALRSGSARGWTGHAHAYGGRDTTPHNPRFAQNFAGGAGTVFKGSTGKRASAEARAGTLTIDAGDPVAFPQPDGTVLPDRVSNRHRSLVIAGEAVALGRNLRFHSIKISGGSVLSTLRGNDKGDWLAASAPADERLDVTADSVRVLGHSRIEMTGRGDAGGPGRGPPYAASSPVGHPSTFAHGGSHGGQGGFPSGGNPGGTAAATYDSVSAPHLPGSGAGGWDGARGANGGGLLILRVGTLTLNGSIVANGIDEQGPTGRFDSAHRGSGSLSGGGGGGGIDIRTKRFDGSGGVFADGGSVCLRDQELVPVVTDDHCDNFVGIGGAGGGGRIALRWKSGSWMGPAHACEGYNHQAPDKTSFANSRGTPGTVYLKGPSGKRTVSRSCHPARGVLGPGLSAAAAFLGG